MALFRKLAIRALLPLTWRRSRKMLAARLARFGVTESDSGWQILHVLDHVDDPALRRKVLQHALEEVHHAHEFDRAARPIHHELPPRPKPERDPLYDPETGTEGLVGFVAYAYVGEWDVFDQFDSYAAGLGECEAQSVFREAKLDEYGHVQLTWDILTSLVDEKRARWEVFKIRARRIYEAWLRFSKGLGTVNFTVLLSALYLLFGPLLALPCRHRLR